MIRVYLSFVKRLLLVLLLIASTAVAGELRDGDWWMHLTYPQKQTWAIGWMDGLGSGAVVSAQRGTDAYKAQFDACKFVDNMATDQLVRGLDQFYAADYRNLPIRLDAAAVFVARYARGELTKQQVINLAETFRH